MAFGEDLVGALGWDGHLLLLHRTEQERRSRLAAWVRRGLERGEKVICAESEHESPQRSARAVLRQYGVDVDAARVEGRFQVVSLPEFYPRGYRDMVGRALAEGYTAVRISAEAHAALTVLSEEGYADIERSIDLLCRTRSLSSLCQYDSSPTPGDWLRRTTAIHAGGIREWQLHTSRADGVLSLAGEIDTLNELLVVEIVAAVTRGGLRVFRLELSRVDFLSVGGLTALLEGTRQFRDRGGRLLLEGPQPMAERTLRLAGLDRFPNVEVVGPSRDNRGNR